MNEAIFRTYSGEDDVYNDQIGGALPFFVGKQYGGGWLNSLARIAFPILQKFLGIAGNVAQDTAKQVIYNNRPIMDALKSSAVNAVTSYGISKMTTPSPPSPERKKNTKGHGFLKSTINRAIKKQKKQNLNRQKLFPLFS
jgi:hypothetical protein